jgi:hypothetical protein
MLASLLLVAYLLIVSLSLHSLAVILYCQDRHSSELRGTALGIFALGATSLALAWLLWTENNLTAKTLDQATTAAYAESTNGGADEKP